MRAWRWGWVALAAAAALVGFAWWALRPPEVVDALPAGDALAYLNLVPLREAGWLSLGGAVPPSPDYAAFTRESGFEFERDLDAVAVSLRGSPTHPDSATVSLAGRFGGRFTDYLRRHALRTVEVDGRAGYVFPGWARPDQPITVVPLDAGHVLATNDAELETTLGRGGKKAAWPLEFERPLGLADARGGLDALVPGLKSLEATVRIERDHRLDARAELDCETAAEAARILNAIEQWAKPVVWMRGLAAHLDGTRIRLELEVSAGDVAAATGGGSGRG